MFVSNDILAIASQVLVSESESVRKAVGNLNDDFAGAVEAIFYGKGKLVVTGIGKSAHIATKIVATLNSTGTPSVFMHAAEAVHGDLGIITPQDVILCISKSGNSPEIKSLVPLLKRDGNTLIGITADENSFLGKASDFVLNCYVERESCPNNLAPTNSTIVQLALGDALAVSLMSLRNFSSADFAKFHPGGALGKKLLLQVKDILKEGAKPKVYVNTGLRDIIFEISNKRLGVTAVLDDTNKVVGIITDGDIRRMLEKTTNIEGIVGKDIMSCNPKQIEEENLVSQALNLLENNNITQLVVIDKEGNYQGIVHLHDILKEGIVL